MVAQTPNGNLDEFLENVNREIARRANYISKRKGKFWARRYSDQIVLSEADAEKAFLYVTANPTKHGLVRHCKQWPGVSSYQHCLDGMDRVYSFTHFSKKDELGRLIKTKHKLKLSYSQFGKLIRKFKKQERQRRSRYKEASFRFRLGDVNADFPSFSHKPPMHRYPRNEPFKAIKVLPEKMAA